MKQDRSSFDSGAHNEEVFTPLVKQPKGRRKSIEISGEENFDNSSFNITNEQSKMQFEQKQIIHSPIEPNHAKKRGRPVEITDDRFKVTKPKKISPALESKLSVLQDYMVEFQDTTGRITFEMVVATLAESYISHRLGVAKEEHIQKEIQEMFDKLK
ncbi:hypothetical protein [Listeria innocua]|uniref:hypothetical protein n=1 Tax=Listeria innocua TaxID=1642 RepID=UPI0016294149|nr:hypothetical protein [Listeria innocua]MBC1385594.1 hypothetical protein [Listeria innocua]